MEGDITTWTIDVVGQLTLRAGQGGDDVDAPIELRPKERAVLAALAFADPDSVDADQITSLVWEDHAPKTARKSIHNHIARIRAIDDGLIDTHAGGYRLGGGVEVDTIGSLPTSDMMGEPFADLADTPEVEARRAHVRALVEAQRDDALADDLRGGATPELLGRLHEAVVSAPYNERRWYLLALAQARLDQRRDALRTLRSARTHLAEVGLSPGPTIVDLEAHVLEGAHEPDDRPHHTRAAIHPHERDPFVGRQRELTTLSNVWRNVLDAARPHLMVVSGPSGIGKTRLVQRFASLVGNSLQGDDAAVPLDAPIVMWGRCRRSGQVPHEALLTAAIDACEHDDALRHRAHDALGTLVRMRDVVTPVDPGTIESGSSAARDLVHALRDFLDALAPQPAVWLIDDVQWMSADSIELLTEALKGFGGPLFLIATQRPDEAGNDAQHALSIGTDATRLDLNGLTVEEIASLVDAWRERGNAPTPTDTDEAARILFDRTAGHPLYATEIARRAQLAGEPVDPFAAPPALDQWVAARVAELPDDVATMLRFAAVVGRRVEPAFLARCLDASLEDTVQWCDTAVTSGLLTTNRATGAIEFSHAITCETVYALNGPARVTGFHARVCDMLERSTDQPEHAVIAHHARSAGSEYRQRAMRHALLAGQRHFARGSWNDAVDHFSHAADSAPGDGGLAEALSWLGQAQARQGRLDLAEPTLRDALSLARLDGLVLVQARATLALAGRAGRGATTGSDDSEQLSAIRTAISHLARFDPPSPSAHREATILMSGLERELAYGLLLTDQRAEREALLVSSLERVQALTPTAAPAVASAVLASRYRKLAPEFIHERIADIDDVLAMPPRAVGPEIVLTALTYRLEELVRLGEFGAALDTARDAETLLERYPHPYWAWAVSTWRVVLDLANHSLLDSVDDEPSLLDSAEQRTFDAFEARKTVDGAAACLAVNLVNIRLYQGRAHEMLGALAAAIDTHPELPVYRAVHALCASSSGDAAGAAAGLGWFIESGFDAIPRDTNRLLALGVLGHVAADLGHVEASTELAHMLRPFDGQWVVISCYGGGGAVWGPVASTLARLDAVRLADVS